MVEMLYFSSVDISVPNGPGVNELQFILASYKVYGDQAHYVVPAPAFALPQSFPVAHVTFLTSVNRRKLHSRMMLQVQRLRSFRRLRKTLSPRYVVFRSDIFPLAEIAIALHCVPVFLKTSGAGRFEVFDRSRITKAVKPVQTFLFSTLLRLVTGLDVVSKIQKESLEKCYSAARGKVEVIDNAVNTDIFAPVKDTLLRKKHGLDQFKHIIGYVGNFAHERGATEMIEAWRRLNDREAIALVVISGDGAGLDGLRALAEDCGAGDNVFFMGPISMTDLAKYISMLDVGVSLRDDDGCSELKVRQYLACGVPVVVSAQVNAFVQSARLGVMVSRDPNNVTDGLRQVLDGEGIATRDEIARYAVKYLSYDAAMRYRRERWMRLANG